MDRALTALVLLAACAEKAPPAAPPRAVPVVVTSFYPSAYFAERIGGALVEVRCPVPADADPAHWKPTRADVAALQDADLIVLNGAGFERWPARVSLPAARVVDTAAGLALIRYEEAVTHSHGPGGRHSHEGLDGHTWLDPVNAKAQARAILEALQRRLPERADELRERYDGLAADLARLDAGFRALGTPPRQLYASHPAYNYVARRYGWKIVNVDDVAVATSGVLLWEDAPDREAGGAESVVFSPCEARPEEGDYLTVMEANLERLAAAFRR